MAKSSLMLNARELRRQGMSIKQITAVLSVSKSSVSYWVRDIILAQPQLDALKLSENKGKELGRIKIVQLKNEKRLRFLAKVTQTGINKTSQLTKNELFVSGIALYWAEGGKSGQNRRVEFCNSDPQMIKFFLLWLEKCLNISRQRLRCVVGVNQSHSHREVVIKKYWSDLTEIPLDQFRKTSFKKVSNNKTYENFDKHFGTLTILVIKSTSLYYQIMGLIAGLSQSKIKAA